MWWCMSEWCEQRTSRSAWTGEGARPLTSTNELLRFTFPRQREGRRLGRAERIKQT